MKTNEIKDMTSAELNEKLGELKRSVPAVEEQMPGFGDLVTQLDVLASTEQFKFNRGDYVA